MAQHAEPMDVDDIESSDTTEVIKSVLQPEGEIDEEVVVSENSSPFVSISAEEKIVVQFKGDNLEDSVNSTSDKSTLPPLSPKIVSKGYNLNFDDLDAMNPFATKTKIRMSPPPGASPNRQPEVEPVQYQRIEKSELSEKGKNENRRKSMPEKRKPLKTKSAFNSTFDSTESPTSKLVEPKNQKDTDYPKKEIDIKQDNSQKIDIAQTETVTPVIDEATNQPEATNLVETDKVANYHTKTTMAAESFEHNPDNTTNIVEDIVMSESRKSTINSDNTSSSEQSAYFSAAASSTECTESKNVFNLPEIDDKDFNPFATKSKVRQTPPPDLDMVNPFATKCKIKSSPETSFVITANDANTTVTVDTGSELKDASHNLSTCSDSSRTSDEKDVTVQEVHTEDEDTIEGPFLEAEDINYTEKIPELDDDKAHVDLNNINAQAHEDDTEAAEMFIDAEAFEFLMNQNNTDEVAYSGKESLFLKFDPLFARRVTSEGVAAALSEIKKRQSTPKKMSKPMPPKNEELMSFDELVAGPSDLNKTNAVQCDVEDTHDDMNVTVLSKPMMAVTPAVNPVVTPKKSLTPTRANRLSMTFTSPAMAVIDRLLSLSGNSPSAGLDTTVSHTSRERTEADQALTQLRELLAEKEINVYNLRCESKELKNRLSALETQMKSLEAVSSERLQKINELTENLAEKTKMNRSMAAVVEEYERTIASLISETEQDKKRYAEERMQLIRDRDEQTAHLTSMEVSFSDLHSKYEKSKQVIIGYKTNEEAYKNAIKEFEENLAKMHSNYELLKQHATSKLNHANQELEKLNKAHESEILKYNAMIKRKDLHITSLEESLAQKTKANEELTAICDELINKVG
ncbi:hypothetical protein MSG28_006728 [Choristoneura fumiferana]|uniref:Uncharacterized protein n=1 Tax=Choristoneura fumiferana TaxID=7141 RepID=A0ACC0JKU8_CHOFU|nr:hypothetical protein MSG28_006728 [Choristoneura fumiferana]